jgi:bacterioferritin
MYITCSSIIKATMDKAKSNEALNRAVADELQAVHQYMYFHFHLDDQGLGPLSVLFKRVAIQEMGHAERLAERILFLKGDVDMKTAAEVTRITEPEQMLAMAMQMEEESAKVYNAAALLCGVDADSASKQIFERLVRDEETHLDEFEKQLDNIMRFGPSYLALQSFNRTPEPGNAGQD